MMAVGMIAAVCQLAAGAWQQDSADAILEALQDQSGVPALSAAYVHEGELVWTGQAGFADIRSGVPAGAQTQFRFASVSKLFAATLAARLDQAGRVDLDRPIEDYLASSPVHWHGITLRQLAAHTAGIPHYDARDNVEALYSRDFSSARAALPVFRDRPLVFEPGSDYQYSTFGYTLLSAVLEAATGQTYLDLLHQDILGPLRLTELDADIRVSAPDELTTFYQISQIGIRRVEERNYSYSWAGAGLRGSARDLARFGAAHLDAGFVSPGLWARMIEPALLNDGSEVEDRDYSVGLGWRQMIDPLGRQMVFHTDVIRGGRSALTVFPELSSSMAVLSNSSWTTDIDRTASVLVEPFVSSSPLDLRGGCHVGRYSYSGRFDDQDIRGTLGLSFVDGVCRGEMSVEGSLGEWLGSFQAPSPTRLDLIGLTQASDDSQIYALVTPLGAVEMYFNGSDHIWGAETHWGSRKLEIEIMQIE
jgi:serine beta-lactamase-like protein LACTB